MLYVLISFIVLCLSTMLFSRAAGSLSLLKPNMISYIYYFQVILMTYIASVLVVAHIDNHYIISRVSDQARLQGWMAVMYMMLAFPVGLLGAKLLWAGRLSTKVLLNRYVGQPIYTNRLSGNSLKYSIWVFTFISILACMYTFYTLRYFPFLKALTSSSAELEILRGLATRSFAGNEYIRNILALTLMPLLSYVWAFYYIAQRKFTDAVMFVVSLIFSMSILYYNFAKSPLLWYFLSFIFVYFYALGKFSLWRAVVLVGAAFFGLVAMYALKGVPVSDFLNYNTGPVGRVILSQAAGTYYIFNIFPIEYDFVGFSSMSKLISNMIGYEYSERAARIAMTHFNPAGVEAGEAGVMNSLFIAEAWANFGMLGVLVSPVWVGFLIGSLYIFFLKQKKSPVWLSLFVSFSFGGSFTGGFNDYVYNAGYVVLGFIVAMIYSLALVFYLSGKYR